MPTKKFFKFCGSSLSENLVSNEDVVIPQTHTKKKSTVSVSIYLHPSPDFN